MYCIVAVVVFWTKEESVCEFNIICPVQKTKVVLKMMFCACVTRLSTDVKTTAAELRVRSKTFT